MNEAVFPLDAGEWKALYSPAVIAGPGRLMFISGQIAFDAQGQVVGRQDIVAQARQVFANLQAVLHAAGADYGDVIKMNYYVTDIALWPAVSALRPEYFRLPYPASTIVEVKGLLHPDLLLEIEAVARVQ